MIVKMPHITTVDELSYRLKKARYNRYLKRCEKLEHPGSLFKDLKPLKEYGISPERTLHYFNNACCMDIPLSYPLSEDEASLILYDISTFPLEMVNERLRKSKINNDNMTTCHKNENISGEIVIHDVGQLVYL